MVLQQIRAHLRQAATRTLYHWFQHTIHFLKDNNYRKGSEGMEFYSKQSGAIFRFKTDNDISLLSTTYAPIRIVIVVKDKVGENDVFEEKLLLLTSPQRLLVASEVNKPFDRNVAKDKYSHDTTLILCAGANNLSLSVNVLPVGKIVRQYEVRYDENQKRFQIPDDLNVYTFTQMPSQAVHAQNTTVVLHGHQTSGPVVKYCYSCNSVHHGSQCDQPKLNYCPECHIPVQRTADHAQNCNLKHSFISGPTDVYIEFPVIRCVISMESPILLQLHTEFYFAYAGLVLFSSACDAYFKFTSDTEFVLMTVGFTRIRLPFILQESIGGGSKKFTEKLVLLTSHDRTIVAAMGSRQVTPQSVLDEYEHNTPLVFYAQEGESPSLTVEVRSAGNRVMTHQIEYNNNMHKYLIPEQLDVKCSRFVTTEFAAPMPIKKK